MDFALTEEQEILKKFAREFLSKHYPIKVIRELVQGSGHSDEIWKEIASLGWLGLPFPEKYGGSGMTFFDLAILLEEMGMACMVSPYFSTVVLGGLTISCFGTEEQKLKYLPLISSGQYIFTLALYEDAGLFNQNSINTSGIYTSGNWRITGRKLFVTDAHLADYIICVVKTDSKTNHQNKISLFIINAREPSVKCELMRTRADKLCEVTLHNVNVPESNVIGIVNEGWDIVKAIFEMATIAKCCEMLGVSQKVFDMTLEYSKERKQFGRPIGSFQAIQHYCADMFVDLYSMRVSSYVAASMLRDNVPCSKEIAVAKACAIQCMERIISLAYQIHGAIGFTLDYHLHFYTRRMKNAEIFFGNYDYCRDIMATEIGL